MTELEFAIDLAQKAGQLIRQNFILGMDRSWKSDNSPLTVTDTAINTMVIGAVREHYPHHGVVGEEESNIIENAEFMWVCDPIDGTIPFSHGIPVSVFSLALVHKGVLVVGVVYDPFTERMFTAEAGKGAFLNNKQIHVSDNTDFAKAIIGIASFHPKKYDFGQVMNSLWHNNAKLLNLGSLTQMDVLIACGQFMATIFPGRLSYDTAAAALIVEEAGGKATDLFGKPLRMDQENDGYVLSNGVAHDHIIEIITKNIKKVNHE